MKRDVWPARRGGLGMSQRQRDTHRFYQKDYIGPEGFDVATRSHHPVSLAHEFDHMSAISG